METEAQDKARKGFKLLWACLLAVLLVSCSTLYNPWSKNRQSDNQAAGKAQEKRIPLPPLAEEYER